MLATQFGTLRGAIRLALAYAETGSGLAPVLRPDPGSVSRLVFVCHGNICRSAFAEAAAQREGLNAASVGLSTESGRPAHQPVIELAHKSGLDLAHHRTTSVDAYDPREGDLLLTMEVRHLRKLAAHPGLKGLPRVLLGSYAPTPVPHLHDPYGLSDAYLETCLRRVNGAVRQLRRHFPGAATSR
jgi:protein-tyrosine phosphatase